MPGVMKCFLRVRRAFGRKSSAPSAARAAQGVLRLHVRGLGVVLAAHFSTSACGAPGNDCRVPEARCDGNTASNCTYREDVATSYQTWKTTSCGTGTCQIDNQGAFCALQSAPDPSCDAADTPFCAGAVLTGCRSGYASSTYDCGSGASMAPNSYIVSPPFDPNTPFCVDASAKSIFMRLGGDPNAIAFCAAEAEPNPICQAATQNLDDKVSTRDGNDQLQCWYGYLLKRTMPASGL